MLSACITPANQLINTYPAIPFKNTGQITPAFVFIISIHWSALWDKNTEIGVACTIHTNRNKDFHVSWFFCQWKKDSQSRGWSWRGSHSGGKWTPGFNNQIKTPSAACFKSRVPTRLENFHANCSLTLGVTYITEQLAFRIQEISQILK